MKNLVFDKEYIEAFANEIDKGFVNKVTSHIEDIIFSAIVDIKTSKPVILDYYCDFANEYLTDAQTQNSTIDVFLVIKSPQVELNSISHTKNRLKALWNQFLLNLKANKKKKKRRFFNKKKKDEVSQIPNISLQKYNIVDLKKELFNNLAKYLSTETFISETIYGYKINGKDEFGVEVNIIPVLKNGSKLKIYNSYNSKFIDIDQEARINNLTDKVQRTNGNFLHMLRIFNNLYYHTMGYNPNQIFMESLLYSCPDELFFYEDSIYDSFFKVSNYINMISLGSIISIMDTSKKLFEEPLNTINAYTCKKFLNQITTMF